MPSSPSRHSPAPRPPPRAAPTRLPATCAAMPVPRSPPCTFRRPVRTITPDYLVGWNNEDPRGQSIHRPGSVGGTVEDASPTPRQRHADEAVPGTRAVRGRARLLFRGDRWANPASRWSPTGLRSRVPCFRQSRTLRGSARPSRTSRKRPPARNRCSARYCAGGQAARARSQSGRTSDISFKKRTSLPRTYRCRFSSRSSAGMLPTWPDASCLSDPPTASFLSICHFPLHCPARRSLPPPWPPSPRSG
jgi:hypothetical protein